MAHSSQKPFQPQVDRIPTGRLGRRRVQKAHREPVRRSARLQQLHARIEHLLEQNTCPARKIQERPNSKKRKRADAVPTYNSSTEPEQKRRRRSFQSNHSDADCKTTTSNDPIDYWRKHNFRWPAVLFQSVNMRGYLSKKRSSGSLRRKQSASGSLASGLEASLDQRGDSRSVKYQDPRFRAHAEENGIFFRTYVRDTERGPTSASEDICQKLLANDPPVPTSPDCLFSDGAFQETCEAIEDRNEAKVVQDIARLIVPSPQALASTGMRKLRCLTESVNEGWNNCNSILSPRPQPDFSVGYKREAFSKEQLRRLEPFLGKLTDTSDFLATHYMLFPLLTCEVKCGAGALDIADRQNAHSAAVAVRSVVQLFRLVHREKELHREILAFSISHNDRTVQIYGHFPAIDGEDTTYHRHLIRGFSFTEQKGREKWTAYKFTKSIYEQWMPTQLARISSAIEQIPLDLDFSVPQGLGASFPNNAVLSQAVESYSFSQSDGSASLTDEQSQLSSITQPNVTPDTSLS